MGDPVSVVVTRDRARASRSTGAPLNPVRSCSNKRVDGIEQASYKYLP